MQVSGRITHSFFCFLDQRHFDTSQFHELTNIEIDFIKDPSMWMDIKIVEKFLKKISQEYGHHFIDKDLITAVGHKALELKAWGDLDDVLQSSPFSDFYIKIDEILQWFVAPVEIHSFRKKEKEVSFQCNLSSKKYPYVVEYLRSVLETLPCFQSKAMTEVKWEGDFVHIQEISFGQMSLSIDEPVSSVKNVGFKYPHTKRKSFDQIKHILGREILDSRGQAGLEVEVWSSYGKARASVPSGASTGRWEAHELRDGDPQRFHGKGLLKACQKIQKLSQKLKGTPIKSIEQIDQTLIEMDGTKNKNSLGANVILGISIACAKLLAQNQQKSFYSFFNSKAFTLPVPLVNVLNGGLHADNNLDVQEFMLVPHGFSCFREALRAVSEVFHTLKLDLKKQGLSTTVGDEGGVAPFLDSNETALQCLVRAIEKTGYRIQEEISLALDVAASSFYDKGYYLWEGKKIKAHDLIAVYDSWVRKYPIVSIEDGLEEDQWEDWIYWTKLHGKKIQIVGDDLFVTNCERLQKGIQHKTGNSLLVKVNQIGSLTEAYKAVQMAHQNQYSCIMSHRSGETESSFIADLSIAFECEQIKTGGVSRGERTSKYNQLLRIEEELGERAQFQKLPFK